jgi:Flp pilus assembly protein TadD
MKSQIFTLPTRAFDLQLLPPVARTIGTSNFRKAVGEFFGNAFAGFGGNTNVIVRDDVITVSWETGPVGQSPLQMIVEKLQRGDREESIQLLNLLLARDPNDVDVLYNLALALSDRGNIDLAESHLRRVVELAPNFVNGLAALGTVLTRKERNVEAKSLLESAARMEPSNGWVLRNLGVILMKEGLYAPAAVRFREAVTGNLTDQGSWVGLGDALRLTGEIKKSEEAYRHAIALNPRNDFAEAARAGLGQLAASGFRAKAVGGLRPDAVEYCAAAIKTFSAMPEDEVKKIAMEIAAKGATGLDIDSAITRYELKSLQGDFNGVQLVCYIYVAFQRIAPGTDVGFDLSKEYEAAKSLAE